MKKMATKIAAVAVAVAFAIPSTAALADHRNDRGDRFDQRTLSKKEAVKQVMHTFDRIDRNNNGKISRKEVKKFQRHANNRHGYRYARYDPYRYDTNQDLITLANFRKYDRNHDGVIRRHEAKRSIKRRFERADRNNDGYLNKREIRRAGWYDFDLDYDWERGHHRDYDYERDRDRRHRR